MKVAEQLKNEGIGTPDFTKEQLMESVKQKIRNGGSANYIIGRHVGTDLSGHTIGACNPYNRPYLLNWLGEEGFRWEFNVNRYGVVGITITI